MIRGVVLFIFIAINGFWLIPGDDEWRAGKLAIFSFAMILASSVWIGKRYNWFLAAAVTYFAAYWIFISRLKLYGLLMCLGTPAMLWLAHVAVKEEDFLFYCLRVSGFVQAALSIYQWFGGVTFNAYNPAFIGKMQGSMGHPIVVGAFFVLLTPIAFKKFSKYEGFFYVGMCIATGSSTAIAGLFGSLMCYLYKNGNSRIFAFCVVLCIFTLLGCVLFPSVEFFSISGRQIPWARALELIGIETEYGFGIGFGPGSWSGEYERWAVPYKQKWDFVHNDHLQLIFEAGIGGYLLTATGIAVILEGAPTWAACAIVGLLVNAIGNFPFHIPQLAFIFCVLLAVSTHNGENEV